ncbi:hypothetical protein FAI40_04675 [Acetobacteraceae bacterium]|nr:hypothetical protein FAI40_04675 [Acetobacteraceae bacterium]
MSILPLSGFLSGIAGRALDGWAQNVARNQWGLFYNSGSFKIARKSTTIFGRNAISLINSFIPGESPVFPEASLESVELSEAAKISTAPKQNGQYVNTDKSETPTQWQATFVCDGRISPVFSPKALIPDISGLSALENRQNFLDKLRSLIAGRQYLKFRIPEGEYIVCPTGYKIQRDSTSIECFRAIVTLEAFSPNTISEDQLLKGPKNLGRIAPQTLSQSP